MKRNYVLIVLMMRPSNRSWNFMIKWMLTFNFLLTNQPRSDIIGEGKL